MHLTTYTDYTLRVMMYLALKYKDGSIATIDEMAGAYGISRNHLMKIVNELAQNGFIETVRGRAGGARLARPPSHISIGTLVRMAEKDFSAAACHDSRRRFNCAILPACNLRNGLRRAMDAFLYELDKMTLDEAVITPTLAASLLGTTGPRDEEIVVPPPRFTPRGRRRAGAEESARTGRAAARTQRSRAHRTPR